MELPSEEQEDIEFSQIDFDDPEEVSDSIFPEDTELDILYEDDHMLIINKPSGLIVHPVPNAKKHFTGTLVNCLLHRYPYFADFNHPQCHYQPGIVHRLDLGTSGCMAIAKTEESWHNLRDQFVKHSTQRIYVGFVHQILRNKNGTINKNLMRHPQAPNIATVVKDDEEEIIGVSAITHYNVLSEFPHETLPFSLCSFKLETGRNHQIRP
eukprot:UN23592